MCIRDSPYNINRLTLLAGEASIDDEKYFRDNINKIIENREYTSKELKNMGFEVLPSKTNFVFARSKNIDGERLYKLLKENGILVRHFNKKRIEDFIRVTIGTKEQMLSLIHILKQNSEHSVYVSAMTSDFQNCLVLWH